MGEVDLQRKKNWTPTVNRSLHIFLPLINAHTISSPTFLFIDTGNHPGYFADVGGVVWEFVCYAAQGHSVAVRLQLLNRAFVFELGLCC